MQEYSFILFPLLFIVRFFQYNIQHRIFLVRMNQVITKYLEVMNYILKLDHLQTKLYSVVNFDHRLGSLERIYFSIPKLKIYSFRIFSVFISFVIRDYFEISLIISRCGKCQYPFQRSDKIKRTFKSNVILSLDR